MPTVTIDAAPSLTARERRTFAVRLTRWFADRGVDPSHAIIRFRTIESQSVFSGGLPLEVIDTAGELRAVLVVCHVSHDRDESFRDELANALHALLDVAARRSLFVLEFRLIDPRHMYVRSAEHD